VTTWTTVAAAATSAACIGFAAGRAYEAITAARRAANTAIADARRQAAAGRGHLTVVPGIPPPHPSRRHPAEAPPDIHD
jgi:hypothetical protein